MTDVDKAYYRAVASLVFAAVAFLFSVGVLAWRLLAGGGG